MLRNPRMILARLVGAMILMGGLGCQEPYTIAEGTTEAGNPAKVAGRIYDTEGNGVAARVRLIPEAYRNQGPGDDHPYAYEAWSDKSGAFGFPQVASGRFNLVAAQIEKGGRLLVRSINVLHDTDLTNPGYVVRDPATLKIDLSPVPEGTPGFVYMAGTDLARNVVTADWALGYLLMDSVPAGPLPDIWFAQEGHPAKDDILLSVSAVAAPGDTVAVGKTGVLPKSGISVLIPPAFDTTLMDSVATIAGSAAVVDFPLLLRLDSTNFAFSRSRFQGLDCRFSDRAGRPLPYSIESWDSAAGRASVWLHIDTVHTRPEENAVFLRIGNGPADPVALGTGVFDQSSGWRGVWHFTDTASGTHNYADDATQSGNRGGSLSWHGFSFAGSGIAGNGVEFNGMDDGLTAPVPVQASEAFTISVWFRTSTSQGGVLFDFSQNPKGVGDRQLWMDDYGRITYHVLTGPNSNTTVTNGGAYNDGRWHHIATTWGKGRLCMYIDGRLVSNYISTTSLPAMTGTWTIGHGHADADRSRMPSSAYFQGELDEARITGDVRTPAWISLSYETQKPMAVTRCDR